MPSAPWPQVGAESGLPVAALDAVHARLATPHGIVILDPPYRRYHVELGEVSSYPPGYKENGGVFCHNNPWIMIAECIAGRPERAFDYYRRISPAYREGLQDLHRMEPYVYSQMIAGKASSRHGEAKNSWLTGTAAWNFIAVSQWILGDSCGLRRAADRTLPARDIRHRGDCPQVQGMHLQDQHPQHRPVTRPQGIPGRCPAALQRRSPRPTRHGAERGGGDVDREVEGERGQGCVARYAVRRAAAVSKKRREPPRASP